MVGLSKKGAVFIRLVDEDLVHFSVVRADRIFRKPRDKNSVQKLKHVFNDGNGHFEKRIFASEDGFVMEIKLYHR